MPKKLEEVKKEKVVKSDLGICKASVEKGKEKGRKIRKSK